VDEAAYVVRGGKGAAWCLLCSTAAGSEHVQSAAHAAAVAHWEALAGRWDGLAADVQQARSSSAQHHGRRSGIFAALRGEAHAAICGRHADRAPPPVEAAFWHRVVKPRLASLEASADGPRKQA